MIVPCYILQILNISQYRMAKVDNNSITAGLKCKVDNLVFRRRGITTSVYVMSPRTKPFTGKQTQTQKS
jgi:hypothetical protein